MSGSYIEDLGGASISEPRKFYWWEVYLRTELYLECDVKFWRFIPSFALNLHYPEFEIGWLCFELAIRKFPKVHYVEKSQIIWNPFTPKPW